MKKYKNQVEENEEARHDKNLWRRQNAAWERAGVAITEIEEGTIAQELGILPGARLLEINGERARDIIQLKSADTRENLTLTIADASGQITNYDIEKDIEEALGLGLDAELFDGVRRCTNKCPFCFVDQLPARVKGEKNLRRTLYVRDDDYRLSFLHGHYITLTNLKDADFARIIEEKLSPLCVSVHATDPATRIRMLGNPDGGQILEKLEFLIENGISINTQIVLCPEVNDGEVLERSIRDLRGLYPGVESMAIVPAGLTKFLPSGRGMRTVRPDEARRVLEQIQPFQKAARRELGLNFVYASDEMYLLAGQPMPSANYYDGFPQFANGVGTIRAFLDDVSRLKRRKAKSGIAPKITLVTGALAAPALGELADVLNEKNWAKAEVFQIENTFWGGNVGCAGLIMGEEILAQMKGRNWGDFVFLPPDAVDNQNRMLDDITLADLSTELGSSVRCDANGPIELAKILGQSP